MKTRAWRKVNQRKWAAFALTIRVRDSYTCQMCGGYGNAVDHIKPLARGGAVFDPANCQTLCAVPCHRNKTIIETGYRVDPEREKWRAYMKKRPGA